MQDPGRVHDLRSRDPRVPCCCIQGHSHTTIETPETRANLRGQAQNVRESRSHNIFHFVNYGRQGEIIAIAIYFMRGRVAITTKLWIEDYTLDSPVTVPSSASEAAFISLPCTSFNRIFLSWRCCQHLLNRSRGQGEF